jgi:CHAT domain-containing protein
VGAQATEERARSIGKDVPLIHYACHAYVNQRFPLDSALVFTIPEDPKPGQANGLLQAWEIFESVRIDADLVTLSACDSGLGKEMGGEGLVGLTRAFQYAGARSVLASLWKVEDESTAELMQRFYGHLKAGKTKDEALRMAQIDRIRSTGSSQPRGWAAFHLIGDWR